MASSVRAQDDAPAEAEYVGSLECYSCHGRYFRWHEGSEHAQALQDNRSDTAVILGDFSQGADIRTVRFPGEAEARPFTASDIAYAIGTGRYIQRYLYEVAPDEYALLPAEWNSLAGRWQLYRPAAEWPSPAYDWLRNCAGCHTTGLDLTTGRWQDAGVQCESCHGPGSIHVDEADRAGRGPNPDELARIRTAIVVSPDPQVCGQCHSQGIAVDGDLPFAPAYRPGQPLDASFTLLPPNDSAHFWPTGHARSMNAQFNEWSQSAHTTALETLRTSATADETCLGCHSTDYRYTEALIAAFDPNLWGDDAPPEPLTVDTAGLGVACITCHDQHSNSGTAFQLTDERYALCVGCHNDSGVDFLHHPVQQMFEGRTVVAEVEGIASSHFTSATGPDCVTCHMERVPVEGGTRASHTLFIVLPGEADAIVGLDAACTSCHADQVNDQAMQQLIDDVQASTEARLAAAEAALAETSPDWVQTALAFIRGDGSRGIHNYAYTDRLLDAVEAELGLSG